MAITTGFTVKKQRLYLQPKTYVGPAVCKDNPTDCCGTGSGTGTGTGTGTGGTGPPVLTTCCANELPHTLHLTITGATFPCTCLNTSFAIVRNPATGYWEHTLTTCASYPVLIQFTCNGSSSTSWIVSLTCLDGREGTFDATGSYIHYGQYGGTDIAVCDPFHVQLNGPLNFITGNGAGNPQGVCCFFGQTVQMDFTL